MGIDLKSQEGQNKIIEDSMSDLLKGINIIYLFLNDLKMYLNLIIHIYTICF